MRRGLQLAEGFVLYIAVCNSPATVRALIDALRESMPGVEIETVDLDESVEDPLARVLALASPDTSSPLMIVGLERSCPSAAPQHPVLHVLNLQRPEWPKRIPRPVVLWIPEYLLSLMGTEAPDFLDWRSDTLFFLSEMAELQDLTSAIQVEGLDGRMPERQRLARIGELQARLRSTSSATDPVVLSARSNWLAELGNQLLLVGHVDEAETAYQAYLESESRLQRLRGVGRAQEALGAIAMRRRDLAEAGKRFDRSLEIAREAEDLPSVASAYGNLGLIALQRNDLALGEALTLEALNLLEKQGDPRSLAITYGNLALIYLRQGRLEEAERLLSKAVEASEKAGDRMVAASNYRLSSQVNQRRGDYGRAVERLREALAIDEDLGNLSGIASSLLFLAGIYKEQGDLASARESGERARNIYRALGTDSVAEGLDEFLASLPAVNT